MYKQFIYHLGYIVIILYQLPYFDTVARIFAIVWFAHGEKFNVFTHVAHDFMYVVQDVKLEATLELSFENVDL